MIYPEFIKFKNWPVKSCLRKTESSVRGRVRYWRDGGAWGIFVKRKGRSLVVQSDHEDNRHLHGEVMLKCSRKEWFEDNGRYVPKEFGGAGCVNVTDALRTTKSDEEVGEEN